MPTRFYFPSTGTPDISPAISTSWNVNTAAPVRVNAVTTRTNTAMASASPAETSTTVVNVFHRQYISAPLEAQTISGTVSGLFKFSESNAGANAAGQLIIRVVQSDGVTIRGTLYGGTTSTATTNPTNEATTAMASRLFPGQVNPGTLTSLAVQQGDRLVIEVGSRNHNTVNTSYTTTIEFGDNNATDYTTTGTTTTPSPNPWVEFSQTLNFYAPPPITVSVSDNVTIGATDVITNITTSTPQSSTAYRDAVLATTGLVAYWKLDETTGTSAIDSSPNAIDLDLVANGPVQNQTSLLVSNEVNPSYYFDGVNDKVSRVDTAALNITGDLTIEAWVKPAAAATSTKAIVEKTESSTTVTTMQYRLGMSSNNRFHAMLAIAGVQHTIESTAVPSTTVPTHLVLRRSGNELALYVNNVKTTYGTVLSGATQTFTGDFSIGTSGSSTSSTRYFNGNIDEVSIYNAALSDTAIGDHYTKGSTVQQSTIPVTVGETTTIGVAESFSVLTTTFVTLGDSPTISATEGLATQAFLPVSDTRTISESSTFTSVGTLTPSDTGTLSVSESFTAQRTHSELTLTDTPTISATESLTVVTTLYLALSDSGTIGSTETMQRQAFLTTSDTGTVTSTESFTALGHTDIVLSDTASIMSSESLASQGFTAISDSGTITGTETRLVQGFFSFSDTATLTSTEDSTTSAFVSSDESPVLGSTSNIASSAETVLTDDGTILSGESVQTFARNDGFLSDVGTISSFDDYVSEGVIYLQQNALISIEETLDISEDEINEFSDTGTILSTSTFALSTDAARQETGLLESTENTTIFTQLTLEDQVTLGSDENSSIDTRQLILFLTDTIQLNSSESLSVSGSGQANVSDNAYLGALETFTIVSITSFEDTASLDADETIAQAAYVTAGDTGTLSYIYSLDKMVAVQWNDLVEIDVTEHWNDETIGGTLFTDVSSLSASESISITSHQSGVDNPLLYAMEVVSTKSYLHLEDTLELLSEETLDALLGQLALELEDVGLLYVGEHIAIITTEVELPEPDTLGPIQLYKHLSHPHLKKMPKQAALFHAEHDNQPFLLEARRVRLSKHESLPFLRKQRRNNVR